MSIDQIGVLAALLFSLARTSATLKPLWGWLPAKFQWLPPLLAVALPQIAEALQGAKTKEQLIQAGVLAVALIVPGVRSATHKEAVGDVKPPSKPPGPPAVVAAMFLMVTLCLPFTTACGSKPEVAPCDPTTLAKIVATCTSEEDCNTKLDERREFCAKRIQEEK